MIKQQHKLLKYHMLPVQVPGRSSNRRCRSRVTSDRAFGPARPDVRYTSNSDQILQSSEMSRMAMCGRLQVGKDFLHACSIGRCGHVFGLRMRFT
jgi:hypothetical protein